MGLLTDLTQDRLFARQQFRSFLSELPAAASSSNRPQSELIVFRSTHLPLLSKVQLILLLRSIVET